MITAVQRLRRSNLATASHLVIRAESLSKRYRIGPRERYLALRDVLARPFNGSVRWLKREAASAGPDSQQDGWIWALKDVSFEVKQGEAVGIIGRNGAGKSTLLKILARITRPSLGRAEVRGRMGSLLEVGTGFHPELTGRENIYLNGAILGMKKKEIGRKFDQIVAFAEVAKFIDTPVKHYSSGMHVRLAFAVAAHLEPEVLLVDEVLAVGDAAFQKKCLGKMREVGGAGRTVMLVSHQMNAIRKLCSHVVWLEAGRVKMFDSTTKVVSAYEAALSTVPVEGERTGEFGHLAARFLSWEIVDARSGQPNLLMTQGPVRVRLTVQVNERIHDGVHGIALWNGDHQLMWGWAIQDLDLAPGRHTFEYTLPGLPLKPGTYSWHVSLYRDGALVDEWYCVPELIIATLPLTHPLDEWSGVLNIPCGFRVLGESSSEPRLDL